MRELFLKMGYVDASREVCHDALVAGQSLFICVGGGGRGVHVLVPRTGRGRIGPAAQGLHPPRAQRHGAGLVPVFGVGHTDTYTTYRFGLKWRRLWLQKTAGVALPLFHGRWYTTLPHPVPVRVVVGEPIVTPVPAVPGEKPSEALVDEYHRRYVQALRELHAAHVPERTLIVR